jgi:hypothetical protein
MRDLAYLPVWDRENQRFTMPQGCPYPDCASPLDPVHASEPSLGWCAVCDRPYEVVPFRSAADAAPIDLTRRPGTAYCTYTGQRLTEYSVLDWGEAGGEPGRSYCQNDNLGAVFGRPSPRRAINIVSGWAQNSVLTSRDDEDYVSSVSVVRGWVVAVTARGWIGLFDAVTGEPAQGRPLEWPTGSTHPVDPDRSVHYPPAFRGTWMVLAAPHEAQFRDLRPFLCAGRGVPVTPHRMVMPKAGHQFLGSPLGLGGSRHPLFCLLEGQENMERRAIEAACLRFFDQDGAEVASCPVPEIARAPVFDRHLDRVIWVDALGRLSTLEGTALREGKIVAVTLGLPDPILTVEVNLRPTFAVVRNAEGRSEVWLSSSRPEGDVDFHRALLEEEEAPRRAWRWQTQTLSKIGQVMGFSVGLASPHRYLAVSQLLAVATDRQVLVRDRSNLGSAGRSPMTGPESLGRPGSYDVPLLCAGGVIARLQGSVTLDSQGLGWSDEVFRPQAEVPGLYQRSQGMAMFGRRVYIGHGMGVRSFLLEIKEIP